MSKKLAILVSKKYSKEYHQDDVLLKEAMEAAGVETDIINWDNEHYDFSKVDGAIIRSCWDYDQRVEEFLETIEKISKMTTLINPYSTIKNNSDKSYLKVFSNKGIPIVETYFLTKIYELPSLLNRVKSDTIIIKPSVSASGRNTYRLSKSELGIKDIVCDILKHSTVLIQPFYDSVQTAGEKSTVVINDEVVFTMNKKPKEGGYLVHTHLGGTYTPDEVSKKDESFIKDVIKHLPDKTAYVRIDYLFNENNEPRLLELELIEPNLYLNNNPRGLKLLSDYILQTI